MSRPLGVRAIDVYYSPTRLIHNVARPIPNVPIEFAATQTIEGVVLLDELMHSVAMEDVLPARIRLLNNSSSSLNFIQIATLLGVNLIMISEKDVNDSLRMGRFNMLAAVLNVDVSITKKTWGRLLPSWLLSTGLAVVFREDRKPITIEQVKNLAEFCMDIREKMQQDEKEATQRITEEQRARWRWDHMRQNINPEGDRAWYETHREQQARKKGISSMGNCHLDG